ncbi:MAG: kelch repeat-containing protein [bacterium]
MKRLKLITLIMMIFSISTLAQDEVWEIIGEMSEPVAGAAAITYGEYAYLIGGYAESTQSNVDWIHRYTFQSGQWWLAGYLQFPRLFLIANLYNDSTLICGGAHDSRLGTNDLENWGIIGTSATTLYDYSELFNRIHGVGTVKGDILYLIGGNEHLVGEQSNLPYIAEYNIPQKVFTYVDTLLYSGSKLPEQQMIETIGNDIFIFGGVFNGVLGSIFKYNTELRTYELLPISLLEPRASGIAVKSKNDDRIYIIGGYNEQNNALSSVEIFGFNGTEYFIIPGPSLNVARKNLSAVFYEDAIYVFGGHDNKELILTEIEKLYIQPVTVVNDQTFALIDNFELLPNHPNPFNPATEIGFELSKEGNVSLDIYSISGKYILTLTKGNLKPGHHEYLWEGKDKYGNQLPSGVYLYRLTAGFRSQTRKMLLLK